ncbi:MAG TPA: hypothetical protein VJG83_02105 [archaeon]|nr:hypothetical protein [archaeon]
MKIRSKDELEYIVRAQHEYKDARGSIDYFVLPQPIHWVGVIKSKKGSIRANHYHPKQQQKCLILSGSCICLYKDLDAPNSPIYHHLAKEGDMVVTEPRVAHAVIYREETLFLNLVKGERDPTNYGKHTIPHEIVTQKEAEKYLGMYR